MTATISPGHSQRTAGALSVPQAFKRLGVSEFSKSAYDNYKQQKIHQAWRQAGIGGVFLGKHPAICTNLWLAPVACFLIICGVALLLTVVLLLNLFFNTYGVLGSTMNWVFYSVCVCVFVVLGGWLFCAHVRTLARLGAIDTRWTDERFSPGNEPEDMPEHGKQLCRQLSPLLPSTARFHLERLKIDRIARVVYEGRSYPFYGWNGQRELLEIEGKLREVPMLPN